MTRWFAGIAAALVVIAALSGGVAAQDYPTRTVKIIVPFPPGGTADAMPRIVADFLAKKWGQAVIIENRAGAGGNTGADAAFHSDPDGYTLFASPPPPLVVNQNLYAKLPFDPAQFIPIAVMGKVPNAILTNSPKLKDVKTVADFVAYAKAHPGELNSATQGVGTTSHLTSELFAQMAGVKFQHIHYRGSAPAVQDLVAGNVDVAFDNVGAAGAHPSTATQVFDVRGTLSIPIFQGGSVHGDVLQADARLQQTRERLDNLRAQIDSDIRTVLLNLQSSEELVNVARSNIDLAEETLLQSRDRFSAGVTDTVEVVQSQEAVASAHERYISSLYSYNFAKISMARALGLAEQGVKEYFKGQ